MKIQITSVKTITEVASYWSNEDYANLLKEFDFPEPETIKAENLKGMLHLAITDFETNEAAETILTYKLGEKLSEGQIQSISHEMTADKVAEEYPEPDLHYDLFCINQFLRQAYNGKFPNTEATLIDFNVTDDEGKDVGANKEILAKMIAGGLKESSLVKRLYSDQLEGKVKFEDAHKFIWTVSIPEKNNYQVLTSNYWINKDDVTENEYDVTIMKFEEEQS
ncbi:hypothetical protein [Mongoliitalea daihaiensis]|uniref:hypothetical protein n=1 Tax=Mongoliitalea daihaiensis TaxID=2782006 RepID=UPI001F165936|nr:hypothetical protein [Mongoliitalea daihaiensis]UJP63649.1 hypothetical protein IPZ59_12475 [Mongoliitalea daihaiensis]